MVLHNACQPWPEMMARWADRMRFQAVTLEYFAKVFPRGAPGRPPSPGRRGLGQRRTVRGTADGRPPGGDVSERPYAAGGGGGEGLCLKGGGHPPPLPTLLLQLYPKARPRPQYPPPALPTASDWPPTDFTVRPNRFVTALSWPPERPPH